MVGHSHRIRGQENQDSAITALIDDTHILLISDGIGSVQDSKVGSVVISQIARRLIIEQRNELRRLVDSVRFTGDAMNVAHRKLIEVFVACLSSQIREELRAVKQYCIAYSHAEEPIHATLLGAVITPLFWFTFRCGDGVIVINDSIKVLEGRSATEPGLISEALSPTNCSAHSHLKLAACGLTKDVHRIILASDGALELVALLAASRSTSCVIRDVLGSAAFGATSGDDSTIVMAQRVP
jgi:hypothetical protein